MKPYFMGYKAAVPQARFQEFLEGQLDANETVLLIQDLIEADLIPVLQERFYDYACHYVAMGWCYITGKVPH